MNEQYAKCIPFDKNVKGRIGGNPPKCIEGQIPSDYKFYATLVHPEKENVMLSIIIHQDYDTLIDNNIYPSIAVKVCVLLVNIHSKYLQPIITQYFIDNKSEIWLLFLIAHSKR